MKIPHLKIPDVFPEYSSDKVLVMEFCEGFPIMDSERLMREKLDLNIIGKTIAEAFSK